MPSIDAVVLGKWVVGPNGKNVPNGFYDVNAWAIANDEFLPGGQSGKGPFHFYTDLTELANVHQRILDNLAIYVAKLEVTVNTAQQFVSDPRFWTLGYWRKDDEGVVIDHNWGTTLTLAERQAAAQYVTNNSAITAQQLAAVFDASDTRAEIAEKLKVFFRR